jgi:hypothetical protein
MKWNIDSEPVPVTRMRGITKKAFMDDRGQWWIYRSDDPNMHTPMGPFFTKGYAEEQEGRARACGAPFPLSLAHPQPAMKRAAHV